MTPPARPPRDADALSASERRLLALIRAWGGAEAGPQASIAELCVATDRAKPAVRRDVARLVARGLIVPERGCRDVRVWRPAPRPGRGDGA